MKKSVHRTKKIALIGVPSSAGARQLGQELTPRCLRSSDLMERLRSAGHDVVDLGDLTQVSFSPDPQNPKQQNLSRVLSVPRQVASAVDLAIANGAWPLVIGGDCTVTIGVLAGLAKHFANLGMIYFDGDLDLNTPETTTSGIFDGMGLAHILGGGVDELSHLGPRYPLLEQRKVTLFGYSVKAGGIDPVEVKLLQDMFMAKYPLEGINGRVQTAAAQALRDLESKAEHILVHFDVDVVDFDDFPAADVPHKPGLSLLKTQEALEVFLGSPKAVGLVLTEFNAKRDSEAKLARRLIDTLVGAITPGKSSRYDDGVEKRRAAES
jgi:arginase